MKIIDLNGNEIEIVNLQLAIMQADDFRHYSTIAPGNMEFSLRQQAYWDDVYRKLCHLEQAQQA